MSNLVKNIGVISTLRFVAEMLDGTRNKENMPIKTYNHHLGNLHLYLKQCYEIMEEKND